MTVAVPGKGRNLSAEVDDCLGRCRFFVVVEGIGRRGFEAIQNPWFEVRDAAGIQASQLLIDRRVERVIVRNIGNNALVTLKRAGVRVYVTCPGSALDAIERLGRGKLPCLEGPTVGFQYGSTRLEEA